MFKPAILVLLAAAAAAAQPLAPVRVSDDGTHFVRGNTDERFIVWGVNYDHDGAGRLLDEYWFDEWQTVVEDFREIKALGANCVRVHLQVGKFLDAVDRPNMAALEQLAKLVRLAEDTGLYLDVTGLACYHKQNIPLWYDRLGEQERWAAQAMFWQSVAEVCQRSPAIFCYDLMNEPILPGKERATDWLAGELGGKYFVQRLTLDLNGRTRRQVAAAWVEKMAAAVRRHDRRHMITVGVIPWAHVFKGAKPLFYAPEVGGPLDFVSVHFYPKKDDIAGSLAALEVYNIGKPMVVEEIFPLKCGIEEAGAFIDGSRQYTDGWISFYWGTTIEQYEQQGDLQGAIVGKWLRYFRSNSPNAHRDDGE